MSKTWRNFSDFILSVHYYDFYFAFVTDTIPEYCKAHPTAVLPKGDNCGHYYNCSVGLTRYGRNVMECPYPDLFSSLTRQCERFTSVECKDRPEHQAPCK